MEISAVFFHGCPYHDRMQAKDDATASEGRVLTLQLKPSHHESFKPQELIRIKGHSDLTLNARRTITLLWHHAHCQGVAVGKDYTIEFDELKADGHKGYEMVVEAVEALMTTILIIQMPDGNERRVQFLGGNDIKEKGRKAGVLTYSFDKRLTEILQRSAIWGQISLPVVRAFTSKYAVSLYENISQKINLSLVHSQHYTLAEFREMVGVKEKRYLVFADLNRHVIKPAVAEINAMSHFQLTALPSKKGKKIDGLTIGWQRKTEDAMKDAQQELEQPKVGRRERASKHPQMVLGFMPSSERLARKDRATRRSPKTS